MACPRGQDGDISRMNFDYVTIFTAQHQCCVACATQELRVLLSGNDETRRRCLATVEASRYAQTISQKLMPDQIR